MNRSLLVTATLLIAALPCSAQFIGDILGGAGYAGTEQDFAAGLSAVVSDSYIDPFASTATSLSEVPIAKSYDAPSGGGALTPPVQPAGGQPQSNTPPAPPPAPSGPIPQLGPVQGTSSGIAGGARATPEQISAWKQALKPVGTSVNSLPADAEAVKVPGRTVKYSKGVFYEQSGAQWKVVPAVVGAAISAKPVAAMTVVADGRPHLYYNGTFFIYDSSITAYKVVQPPIGAVVTNVPDTARKIDRQGAPCYEYAGTCYAPTFRGSTVVYVVS